MSDKSNKPETKKIKIDREKCINCGTCVAMYEDVFEFANDGLVKVKKHVNLEGKNIDEIKAICPQDAII